MRLSDITGDYVGAGGIMDRQQFTWNTGDPLVYSLLYVDGNEEVYVNGLRQVKAPAIGATYETLPGEIRFTVPLVDNDSVLLVGKSDSYEIPYTRSVSEDVVLAAGQVDVAFLSLGTDGIELYVTGPLADNGRIVEFTILSPQTVRLRESFPAGSILTGVQSGRLSYVDPNSMVVTAGGVSKNLSARFEATQESDVYFTEKTGRQIQPMSVNQVLRKWKTDYTTGVISPDVAGEYPILRRNGILWESGISGDDDWTITAINYVSDDELTTVAINARTGAVDTFTWSRSTGAGSGNTVDADGTQGWNIDDFSISTTYKCYGPGNAKQTLGTLPPVFTSDVFFVDQIQVGIELRQTATQGTTLMGRNFDGTSWDTWIQIGSPAGNFAEKDKDEVITGSWEFDAPVTIDLAGPIRDTDGRSLLAPNPATNTVTLGDSSAATGHDQVVFAAKEANLLVTDGSSIYPVWTGKNVPVGTVIDNTSTNAGWVKLFDVDTSVINRSAMVSYYGGATYTAGQMDGAEGGTIYVRTATTDTEESLLVTIHEHDNNAASARDFLLGATIISNAANVYELWVQVGQYVHISAFAVDLNDIVTLSSGGTAVVTKPTGTEVTGYDISISRNWNSQTAGSKTHDWSANSLAAVSATVDTTMTAGRKDSTAKSDIAVIRQTNGSTNYLRTSTGALFNGNYGWVGVDQFDAADTMLNQSSINLYPDATPSVSVNGVERNLYSAFNAGNLVTDAPATTSVTNDDLLPLYSSVDNELKQIKMSDFTASTGIVIRGTVALDAPPGTGGDVGFDPGGVVRIEQGTAPFSGAPDGTGYIVTNNVTGALITGSAEDFSTSDQVIWFSPNWVRIGGSSSGGVSTFAGRSGAVTPQVGDYEAFYPRLDQNETITGTYTFSGNAVNINGTSPRVVLTETDTSNKSWFVMADAGTFSIREDSTATTRFSIDTSGYTRVAGNLLVEGNVGNTARFGSDTAGQVTVEGSNYWSNDLGATFAVVSNSSIGTGVTLKPTSSTNPQGWTLYAGSSSAGIGDGNVGLWDHTSSRPYFNVNKTKNGLEFGAGLPAGMVYNETSKSIDFIFA